MKRSLLSLIVVMVVCLVGASVLAAGLPASKAGARTTRDATTVLDCEAMVGDVAAGCGAWKTLLGFTIKAPGTNKEFIAGGSLVTNLLTLNKTASKGGSKSTTTADAGIKVRVVMDPETPNAGANGTEAEPGEVIYNRRMVELSATLEGQIAACLTLADTNGDGIPDEIQLDEECVQPEVIELLMETESAHHFNFVFTDVPVGVHRLEMQVSAQALATENQACTDLDPEDPDLDCAAQATAFIRQASFTVEQVQFVKDDVTTVEFAP